jgi:hypothetical protein
MKRSFAFVCRTIIKKNFIALLLLSLFTIGNSVVVGQKQKSRF